MKNSIFLFLFIWVLAIQASAQQKPNIIVILADDLGNADVGYHDQLKDIPTPNIDQLAKSGVRFDAGYVTAPVCGPSRAGLLSGQYQQSFGFDDNPGPFRAGKGIHAGIPTSVSIIPEYLKPLGYQTACIGKWHVGHETDEHFPTNRGFDYFFGFLGGAANYYPENNVERTLFKNTKPVEKEDEYLTDAFGREAAEYINTNKDKPFFIYVAFNAVHGPLQTPPENYTKEFAHMPEGKRAILCAMQYAMDVNVGKIITALDDNDLRENTLVFFVSDNGGKIKGNYSYNNPYKGEKGTLYEGGIRLPFCVSWPQAFPKGITYEHPVSTLDILPTILSAVDGQINEGLNGVNLEPYLNNKIESTPHNYMYWRINNKWAVRNREWKLVYNDKNADPELYHIIMDKSETNECSAEYPQVVEELKAKYDVWSKKAGSPKWGWNPKVGKIVRHPNEDFEGISTEHFVAKGSGVSVVYSKNPFVKVGNESENVLEIIPGSKKNINEFGTSARVMQFQKRYRYMCAKIHLTEQCDIYAVLKGKNVLKVKSMNKNIEENAWQNVVFDFREFKGPVNNLSILFKTKKGEKMSSIYIDDVHFCDNIK
ncbi:hypothetical protein E9993_09510 [Labilibacter sediminis]|nr:hypothetical protein E9993_09510 [Labilibacter sediminis]